MRLLVILLVSVASVFATKCCPNQQILEQVANELKCQPVKNYENFEATSTKFISDINSCSGNCHDFLKNGNKYLLVKYVCSTRTYKVDNHTAYPKCCPLDRYYDPKEHKCQIGRNPNKQLKSSQQFSDEKEMLTLNISLSHCPKRNYAIIDHVNPIYNLSTNLELSLENKPPVKLGYYCFDETIFGDEIIRTCDDYNSSCNQSHNPLALRCIRKCCPDGQVYKGTKCTKTFSNGINITGRYFEKTTDESFGVIQAQPGIKAKLIGKLWIDRFGDMHYSNSHGVVSTNNSRDSFYCTETILITGENKTVEAAQVFFMYIQKESTIIYIKPILNRICLLISCVFLFLTILGYLVLDTLNLFKKCIICYCTITLIGYVIIVRSLFWQTGPIACIVIGFMITFSFLGSFTWLNIICFDMYTAFGTMTVRKIGNSRRRTKRFIFYNLYGWGVPIIITLTMFVIYYTKILPWYLTPQIGIVKCFFDRGSKSYDHLIYFVIPLAILILCNAILFLKTIRYYLKVKTEINSMRDTLATDKEKRRKIVNADREKLVMLIKLFLIMGISWLFEVFSSIFPINDNQFLLIVETIWDAFNSLQGLFIFCIFMLKGKMLASFKKKFCNRFDRRASNQSSTTLATNVYSSSVDPRCVRLMSRDKSTEKEF